MRTRNNNIVVRNVNHPAYTVNYTDTKCDGSVVASSSTTTGAVNRPAAARLERMTDDRGRSKSNNCTHRIHTYDINDGISESAYASAVDGVACVKRYSQPYSWFNNSNCVVYTSWGQWDVASDTSVPPYWTMSNSIDEDGLKEDVLEKAKQLKADVLLNLVEGNQIWPSITSLLSSVPQMGRNWKDVRKNIRTASGAFLAWKFGVSPILQDSMAIHRFMPKLKDAVKRHGEGSKQRFSIVRTVPATFNASPLFSSLTSLFEKQGRMIKTPTIRYVLVVEPNTKYYSEFFKNADFVMSRFATSPASFAWEKVPFSFVLDWFVDIRGALRTLDKLVAQPPYKIISFTRSFEYGFANDYFTTFKSPCSGNGVLQSFRSCSTSYQHYERKNVSPDATAPGLRSGFGKNQAGITAALISQMLAKRGSFYDVSRRSVGSLNDSIDRILRPSKYLR